MAFAQKSHGPSRWPVGWPVALPITRPDDADVQVWPVLPTGASLASRATGASLASRTSLAKSGYPPDTLDQSGEQRRSGRPDDAELLHLRLQGGPLHAELVGGAAGAAEHPVLLTQSRGTRPMAPPACQRSRRAESRKHLTCRGPASA